MRATRTRRGRAVPLLAVIVSALTTVAVPDARADTSVHRYSGTDRYGTAAAVAALLHPDGATRAIVATGTSFPDALAAGVAAAALDAPLLLAAPNRLPTAALRSLGVQDVLLIGGTAALPDALAQQLEDEARVSINRIAGDDRYDTAAAVAALATPDAVHEIQAPGGSFATALVAAVHAARVGARLVLVPGLAIDTLVAGGRRFQGDPGELNLALLAEFPPAGDDAVVTTIAAFPDALAAAALAGALAAPVLFTEESSATQASVDTLARFGADQVVVVGGSAAVSDIVLQQLFGYLPIPPTIAPDAEVAIAYDLFVRINAERTARGIAPLVWDPSLAAEAAAWAREMSRSGFRHASVGRNVGENIHQLLGRCDGASCTLPTSGRLHGDWMRSDGNRDNVVEPGYVIGGVGVHCDADGMLWAVERFGLGFGPLSAGGSPAAPVVRADSGGVDCSGAHS